jgi:hypothetical protein
MEEELKKLPMRSVPDDYTDRVMSYIAHAQASRRNAVVALGAMTLALIAGIFATLPEIADEFFVWLNDPFADLVPWFEFEAEPIVSGVTLLALVLAIGLCTISAIFLARLNEQWTGVTT